MPRERSSAAVLAAAKSALGMLQPSERRRYWLLTAAQMATSLLDLVGVLLIGAVGLLATAAVSGRPLPESFVSTLDRFGLADVSIEQLAAWTAVIAALLLITKSLASGMLMRTTFAFLADCQGNLSSRLLSGLMARPILDIQLRSSQRIAYSLTMGTTAVITGLLGCLSLIASDAMLLVLLGAGLLVISPVVTIVAGIYFALVAVILHRSLAAWGARTGRVTGSTNIKSMARIQEGLAAYRELWTLDRRGPYLDETRAVLLESSRSRGTLAFINLVPKFAYDTALVIGALLLTAWQVRSTNLVSAMATLLLFLAAGSRLVPSMLRLNAQLVNVGAMSGQAEPTAELAALVTGPLPPGWRGTRTAADGRPADDRRDFQPVVEVRDVSVVYPGSTDAALDCVRFSVPAGSSVAVVGATGAGKSTLADVIIGLLPTDAGDVRISGLPPFEAITRWPGAVSYVPQHVALIDGSVRANVALALPPDQVDDDAVWNALRRAEVADFIRSLPDGLDTAIGERGVRLSGGQRQRLGLARGLLSDPQVLILDEATSALDADTEHAIGESISAMEGAVTVIVIAHRLATVRRVDALAYLEDGRLVAFGSFDEVRQQVPAFDRQADLMGLNS